MLRKSNFFRNLVKEIMCEIRDALEKQSIVMPYKIDRGQIQDTNGSNEWFTVKFSFSSGDQWVTQN